MTRVLLIGMSPLPTENTSKSYAAGLRTWQFAKALTHAGHDLVLVCCRIPYVYPARLDAIVESRDAELDVLRFDANESALVSGNFLSGLIASHHPECIVGAHTFPSSLAAKLDTNEPIWADLNGHLMAEAQVKASTYDNDFFIEHFWRMEQAILDRADSFSVVSRAQRYATLGELGTRRRLNKSTVGYEFTHVVPVACPPLPARPSLVSVRGTLVPDDAFIVLWSGAYNTWTDVSTLVQGLELSMATVPSLYFVSTGGQVDGHDDLTYPRLLRLIEHSRFKDRFVMRGWLPAAEIPAYQRAADVAINLDGQNLEGEFGTRNRILGWAAAGLPTVSTVACELATELDDRGWLYSFPLGDSKGLSAALLRAASDPMERTRRAHGAASHVRERYSWQVATAPLVAWCRAPRRAPDAARDSSRRPASSSESPRPLAGFTLVDLLRVGRREIRVHWKSGGVRAVAARLQRFWTHERHVLRRLL